MDKKLFSNYLKDKIINVPISMDDLQKNQGIKLDVNYNLPEEIDGEKFIHYYYYNSAANEIGVAVSFHNMRVPDWNKRHPNHQINSIGFRDEILYPVFIKNKTVYDEELFKLVRTIGIESFAKVLNKTALEYFKEKFSLAKKHKITPGLQDKIQSQIVEINEWFINNNIDPDNIELFIDEKRLPFEQKITTLKDNGGQPQHQKKADIREKNYGQEGKQPSLDFKKLIPQDIGWTQIEINILDENSIRIKNSGDSFDVRYSQTQNFVNKTTSKCNNSWRLLLELAQIGCFQPNSSTYKILTKKPGKAKHRVYALGKALMDEFGVIEKPFLPYNSQDGWFPKFTIRDLRKNITRTNLQAEIYKSQQTVKRKQHQDFPPKIINTFSSDDLEPYANEQKGHKDKLDHNDLGFHNITEDKL